MKKLHVNPPRLLITGGAGFLGSHLAQATRGDYSVTIFDNLSRNSWQYVDEEAKEGVEFVRGDITDTAAISSVVAGADVVVHMAAVAGVSQYYEKPYEVMRVNLGGAMKLLAALSKRPPAALLLVSSSEVYGMDAVDACEDQPLTVGHYSELRWTYAVSKIAAEKAFFAWGRQLGVEVVCLRPFNIYGPGQTGEGAVADMIRHALQGEPVVVHGTGEQVRAWCYVDDFTAALQRTLRTSQLGGEVINIGNPAAAVTVRALAEKIIDLTGSRSALVTQAHFGLDIPKRVPDIAKAKRLLAFTPRTSLAAGLAETVDWYRRRSCAKRSG